MEELTHTYLGEVKEISERNIEYTTSELQADTLFNFVDDIEFLIKPLQKKMLTPRYCTEPIEYLNINGIERISFPMKCFCDISFHRIRTHLDWYGYYGLAFTKEWGLKNGIQPVQYINKDSIQCKDFAEVMNEAMRYQNSHSEVENHLKSFLLEQLMFYKPYSGYQYYKLGKEEREKCFSDECEWRYVPDVRKIGLEPLYYKPTVQKDVLDRLSNSMSMHPEVSLHFEYDDLKYIILKFEKDFDVMATTIMQLNCEDIIKYKLISKIIIWENEKEDF